MTQESILVIEDEIDILDILEYNLAQEGFHVLKALDGEVGLMLAREHNPVLVLLDLMLPGMGGKDVCRKLKQDPLTRDIPVIMVTAKSEETDVIVGLGLGAD
ncbi:MAG: response regulator, partial [Planctomycetota bacterium]